jgi:site-specific DNA recombinase
MRPTAPTSAAVYARISHDPSGERLGVQRQEADCLEEAKRRGWSIAQVYVDDDRSAYDTKRPRPEYQRLLQDIQLGLRDGVMIWRLDRLHRQPRELEEFIVICDKHRVALATVTGDVDLATSQGRLLARAWGAFAAHESDIKGERMSRANLERARRGIMRTVRRQYGFTLDGRSLDHVEVQVIREAAARLLRGESLRGICMDLNDRGIPSARHVLWTGASLRYMLGNPRLAGWSTYHGEVVGRGAWKAILTRRQSERIRALFADPDRRTGDGTRRRYLLTGLVHCGRCGARMMSRGNGHTRTYICPWLPGQVGCGRVSINVEDLEGLFLDRLYQRLDSDELPATLQRGHLSDAKWRKAQSAMTAAESRLRSLTRDYATGSLTRVEWQAARPALLERARVAQGALLQNRSEDVVAEFIGHADDLRVAWAGMSPSRQRAIIGALAADVVIWPALSPLSRSEERTLIWWRGEVRPATPRGALRGIAERRAAGEFAQCSVASCAEPYSAGGYCKLHLSRVTRHGEPGAAHRHRMPPYRGAVCVNDGCDSTAVSGQRCSPHYDAWRRDDPTQPRCRAADCGRSAQVGDLCTRHYQRLTRTGSTSYVRTCASRFSRRSHAHPRGRRARHVALACAVLLRGLSAH